MRKAERQRVTRRTRNFTGVLTFQICQFSQTTTLTLPLSQSSRGVTMCFDASTSSVSGPTQTCFDSTSTLPPLAAPPPPQFADSPPDEVSFALPANFSLVDLPTYPPSCLVWDLSELKSFYFCFRRRTCPWRWRIESRGSRPVLL